MTKHDTLTSQDSQDSQDQEHPDQGTTRPHRTLPPEEVGYGGRGERMRFGLAAPIFANPGVVHFRTPNLEQVTPTLVLDVTREAEQLGYDSVWVADHMFLGRDGAILEGWTTLAALAGATSRLRLGSIHLGNGFRNPALTAKMIATLDFLSQGRVEFFIDPGWREREHVSYGFEWQPNRAERVARVTETLELTRQMWDLPDGSHFTGDHFTLHGAICRPAPEGHGPRVWIGEAFDDETLELVAKHADVWNSMPAGVEVLANKIALVDDACRRHGRDPATLAKTLETQVLIVNSDAELDDWLRHWRSLGAKHPTGNAMTDVVEFVEQGNPKLGEGLSVRDYRDEFLIGTVDQIAAKLAAYQRLGVSEVICWFMDLPVRDSLNRFIAEVAPRLRQLQLQETPSDHVAGDGTSA